MVSKKRAAEAVRAVAPQARLLEFLDPFPAEELAQWSKDKDDDELIYNFILEKAQASAAGLGVGSAAGAGTATNASAPPAERQATRPHVDPTAAYLEDCLKTAAGAVHTLFFFCIEPAPSDNIIGGEGSSSGSAFASRRRAQAEPISQVIHLSNVKGRLEAVTATFNIWRLLEDYANSGQPAPEFTVGRGIRAPGSHVSFHMGYVRKSIPYFREMHEQYVSFELLERQYERLQSPKHRYAIIKACKPPRLDPDGTYVVHLAPVGQPCTGPPDNEEELAAAVAGVLRGLAALHAEGYVHRDVRWANVIYLPEDGRWLLIDLEHVGLEGCDCSCSPFPLRNWGPRTLPQDKKYRAASDLRMVAEQLMCVEDSLGLSDAGIDLREKLMVALQEGPGGGSGLTAAQALKHPWLAAAVAANRAY